MKVLLFIYIIFFNGIFALAHDVPIAVFHITQSNDSLEIDITFDLEDFSKSVDINTSEINLESMQTYLAQNINFQFNSQVANLILSKVEIVRDHIKVKGYLGKTIKKINTIRIGNTCLNNVSGHSNIMQIDLNNKSRDYRMHNKRTVINLKY